MWVWLYVLLTAIWGPFLPVFTMTVLTPFALLLLLGMLLLSSAVCCISDANLFLRNSSLSLSVSDPTASTFPLPTVLAGRCMANLAARFLCRSSSVSVVGAMLTSFVCMSLVLWDAGMIVWGDMGVASAAMVAVAGEVDFEVSAATVVVWAVVGCSLVA